MGLLAQANEDVLLSMLDARRVMNGKTMLRPGLEGGGEKGGGGEQLARSEGVGESTGKLPEVDTGEEGRMGNGWSIGPSERGVPLGLVARLATRDDLDSAVREMEPPLLRPDMPRCHAKDLRVPQTFKEARQSEHSEQFMDAAKRERIDNCIKSKLIFDWKVDAFGFPTKAKARLVARGDMQKEYIDFGDLYAPTVASSSVRMLAALACELDLELCHFDIDQAFVRVPLKEDIFMRLPEGCVGTKERCDRFGKDLGEYVPVQSLGELKWFGVSCCLRSCGRAVHCMKITKGRSIPIAKHPISNSNSKHIDVRHHFLRQLVDEKEVEIIHVASKYQHADFLTKALPEREFASHRDYVMNFE
ncbi:unnamed protein product [Ectocarpus sp. CCAP 1310/34]|nr:unnamed protein product [Ectocarpus sp. CCAP 1310/34]